MGSTVKVLAFRVPTRSFRVHRLPESKVLTDSSYLFRLKPGGDRKFNNMGKTLFKIDFPTFLRDLPKGNKKTAFIT